MSHEGARQTVVREGTRFINQVELDLMVATKTGKDHPTFLVPHQQQDGWQTALNLVTWVVEQLRSRDINVSVETRNSTEGSAFTILEQTK